MTPNLAKSLNFIHLVVSEKLVFKKVLGENEGINTGKKLEISGSLVSRYALNCPFKVDRRHLISLQQHGEYVVVDITGLLQKK